MAKKKNHYLEKMQQMYGNSICLDVRTFDEEMFEVTFQPLDAGTRKLFIKDVRALLKKYFGDNFYDFQNYDE